MSVRSSILIVLVAFLFASLSLFVCWHSLQFTEFRLAKEMMESAKDHGIEWVVRDLFRIGWSVEEQRSFAKDCQEPISDDVKHPRRLMISIVCRHSVMDLSSDMDALANSHFYLNDFPHTYFDGVDLSNTSIRSLSGEGQAGLHLPDYIRTLMLNHNSFSQNAFTELAERAKKLEKLSLKHCKLGNVYFPGITLPQSMKVIDVRGSKFGGKQKEINALCALQKVKGLRVVTDRGVMAESSELDKCNWDFRPSCDTFCGAFFASYVAPQACDKCF